MMNSNEKLAVFQFGTAVLTGIMSVGETICGNYANAGILGGLSGISALGWNYTRKENYEIKREKILKHNIKEIKGIYPDYKGDGEF